MAHGLRRLPAAAGGVHRLRPTDDGRRAGLGGLRRPRGTPARIRRQLQPPHRALPRPIPILIGALTPAPPLTQRTLSHPGWPTPTAPSTTLIGGSAGYLERCTGILRLRSGFRTRPGALSPSTGLRAGYVPRRARDDIEARRGPYVTSGPSRRNRAVELTSWSRQYVTGFTNGSRMLLP